MRLGLYSHANMPTWIARDIHRCPTSRANASHTSTLPSFFQDYRPHPIKFGLDYAFFSVVMMSIGQTVVVFFAFFNRGSELETIRLTIHGRVGSASFGLVLL